MPPRRKVAYVRCNTAEKIYRRASKDGESVSYRWTGKACSKNGYGFSLTTGTVFEETKLGLDKVVSDSLPDALGKRRA